MIAGAVFGAFLVGSTLMGVLLAADPQVTCEEPHPVVAAVVPGPSASLSAGADGDGTAPVQVAPGR